MALLVLPLCGCSGLIAVSGKNLSQIETRQQVHEIFGEPKSTTEADGKPVEVFKTHRKIADLSKGPGLSMGFVMTFGLGELIWFPQEAFIAARRSIKGQEIRFTYNESGKVVAVSHDEIYMPFSQPALTSKP